MNHNTTSENQIRINDSSYSIKKKGNGFWISWELSDEQQQLIVNNSDFKVKSIMCHMSIWSKIFYEKHKLTTRNVNHNENKMLKNMREKFIDIFLNNDHSVEKAIDKNTGDIIKDRFLLVENTLIGTKNIVYYYIIHYDIKKEKIKIISIYRSK